MNPSRHPWSGLRPPQRFRYPPVRVEAAGERALFTRPELSSERVSYAVPTPTAAIGLLSAIFWKPEFRWVIDHIEVLNRAKWTSFRRNEAEGGITTDAIRRGHLDLDSATQQRMSTMLCDVHYRIHAHVWVHPDLADQESAKWRAQFTRRVDRGQSFRTPFFGMRELHADIFPAGDTPPFDWTEDLGVMLHSIDYDERSGRESYDWFDAKIEKGVVHIPRAGILAQGQEAAS